MCCVETKILYSSFQQHSIIYVLKLYGRDLIPFVLNNLEIQPQPLLNNSLQLDILAINPKPMPTAVQCILNEEPQWEIETVDNENHDDDSIYYANKNGGSPGLEAVENGIGKEDCNVRNPWTI